MEILVLVKPVPEPESRLRPTADGQRFDPEGVKFVLAGYDESAVEQALLLKEAHPGSKVRVATVGPAARSEEVLRAALALGADAVSYLETPAGRELETRERAHLLASLATKYPSDLILLGKQSGDAESGLLPGALAARLGRFGASSVVDLRFDPAQGRFLFRRVTEGGDERWSVPAPLVVGLQQAWNDPRTAKLQNILKSRRMPIEKLPAEGLSASSSVVPSGFALPPPRTGATLIPYSTPAEAAQKLVAALRDQAKVLP